MRNRWFCRAIVIVRNCNKFQAQPQSAHRNMTLLEWLESYAACEAMSIKIQEHFTSTITVHCFQSINRNIHNAKMRDVACFQMNASSLLKEVYQVHPPTDIWAEQLSDCPTGTFTWHVLTDACPGFSAETRDTIGNAISQVQLKLSAIVLILRTDRRFLLARGMHVGSWKVRRSLQFYNGHSLLSFVKQDTQYRAAAEFR